MSRMDHSIILAGQQPDFVNVLANSARAAALTDQNDHRNKLRQTYQQHGPGILSGDQNALNQLALLDPREAFGIQQTHRQNARMDEQLGMRRKELDLKIQAFARTASAQEKAQVAAQMETAMKRLIPLYQAGNLEGINSALGELGEDPIESLDQFPAVASLFGDTLKTLKEVEALTAPEKPADEYGRYVAEEDAAGRVPMSRIEFKRAAKLKQNISVSKDGTVSINETFDGDDPTDKTSPASPAAMISSIDGILKDPALDFATGWLEWTQNIPGTGSKRFGARAKQLQGQAFLQAFESLKGGGHITEIEGQKATDAIGRLDTAQSPEDYREALTELRGLLQTGMDRKAGKADGGEQPKRMKYNLETGAFE